MALRTDETAVRSIIDNSEGIELVPFIRTASLLVDKVDSHDTAGTLSVADLREIETWLAAHFYAHRDQLLTSKSTEGASGSFQGQTGMYFSSTQYGQTAMLLDTTMYLAGLEQQIKEGKKIVGSSWLGSTVSQVNTYPSVY